MKLGLNQHLALCLVPTDSPGKCLALICSAVLATWLLDVRVPHLVPGSRANERRLQLETEQMRVKVVKAKA